MPLATRLTDGGENHETIRVGERQWPVTFWPLQFAIWGAFSIFPILLWLFDLLKNPDDLGLALIRPVSGFLLTSAVRPFCKRLAGIKASPLLFTSIVIAGTFPLAILDYYGCVLILRAMGLFSPADHPSTLFVGFLFLRWVTLIAWALVYFMAKQTLHNRALAQANRSTEMEVLRAQIHPHFLFNALNAIIAEAKNHEKVRDITQSLADFLRFSLQPRQELEPLSKELAALENYLKVQKVRFEEKLQYEVDADPLAAACLVPAFLVLPLLENALKYGQQTSPLPLRIYVAASVRGKQLRIVVKNSGEWVEPNPKTSLNTGIINLKKRLGLLYGTNASLNIDRAGDGILAALSLPISPLHS